jgi:hypothetical protein
MSTKRATILSNIGGSTHMVMSLSNHNTAVAPDSAILHTFESRRVLGNHAWAYACDICELAAKDDRFPDEMRASAIIALADLTSPDSAYGEGVYAVDYGTLWAVNELMQCSQYLPQDVDMQVEILEAMKLRSV